MTGAELIAKIEQIKDYRSIKVLFAHEHKRDLFWYPDGSHDFSDYHHVNDVCEGYVCSKSQHLIETGDIEEALDYFKVEFNADCTKDDLEKVIYIN